MFLEQLITCLNVYNIIALNECGSVVQFACYASIRSEFNNLFIPKFLKFLVVTLVVLELRHTVCITYLRNVHVHLFFFFF